MTNKIFDRITKIMATLLTLCFVLSMMAVSVNAATFEHRNKFNDHGDKYRQGYKDGYSKGSNDGKKDCNKYSSKEILNKIPDPTYKDKSYSKGFILGYTTGYNEKRYLCLHKIHILKK